MYTLKGYRVKAHIKVYGNNNSEQMTLEYVSIFKKIGWYT